MAKGSVRKKGKKWYYRFYVEDASGNLVQKECVGTESKSETEKLLRQAMDDYEKKKFVAKAENLTVGQLLDVWAEEELKTGTLSNGTVENYLGTIRNIKKHPLAERKLKNVTSEHLQSFFDLLSFGGVHPDGKERKGYSKDYIHSFSAVMQQSFRFAVFPKQYITFNPMQYIKLRYQTDEVDLFSDEDMDGNVQPISREDYERLLAYLQKKNPAAILPIQIAYYAGLRIGEACGLAWQDVNLEEQCLTIRRSIRYDGSKRKYIIGPTKRKKVRIVDFGDTLVEIFRNARKEQLKNRMQYGELYHTNYYKAVKEKNRVYYEYYCLDRTQEVPTDYKEISFVCLRPDGCLELPTTLGTVCRKVAKTLEGFEGFHFHQRGKPFIFRFAEQGGMFIARFRLGVNAGDVGHPFRLHLMQEINQGFNLSQKGSRIPPNGRAPFPEGGTDNDGLPEFLAAQQGQVGFINQVVKVPF